MVVATLAVVLTALVACTTAATVWLVKTRPAREHDPDSAFWYGFTGLCVLLPAILITAWRAPWAGAGLALVAAVTWWRANKVVGRRVAVQAAASAMRRDEAEHAALAARHTAVLTRWSRYETDPAAAIDFPAMADVRIPETSALAKALAAAEMLRRSTDDDGTNRYGEAVTCLELAFVQAERAALDGTSR